MTHRKSAAGGGGFEIVTSGERAWAACGMAGDRVPGQGGNAIGGLKLIGAKEMDGMRPEEGYQGCEEAIVMLRL